MVWTHNLDQAIFRIGSLEIRWYGLMYALSFLLVYWYVKKRIIEGKTNLKEEHLDWMLTWGAISLIIGARLFQVVFYDPFYYFTHPLDILAVWKGGLSFFGGLTGFIIAGIICIKKFKLSFQDISDQFTVPLALGQGLGRLGNFINGELYGIPTNLPWGIIFPGTNQPRHPNQLYELFYNLIIFGVLWSLKNKPKYQGRLLGIFFILYSFFRFVTEFLRADKETVIGLLSLSQWLCIPVLIIGVWLFMRQHRSL
ncbi:prolipoprotein diacylglyceryl transferase [Candidatus Woesearchaeota archaeon]|nr:prolipoprotein diacylglyceryl transferase [Candidatus Woesearchaeota archaeon]